MRMIALIGLNLRVNINAYFFREMNQSICFKEGTESVNQTLHVSALRDSSGVPEGLGVRGF